MLLHLPNGNASFSDITMVNDFPKTEPVYVLLSMSAYVETLPENVVMRG